MSKTYKITILMVSLLVSSASLAQGEPDQDVLDSARGTLAKWVETQQIISKEREAWQLGKEVLEQRIALIEGEIAGLRGKIDEARNGIAEADSKRAELQRDNVSLRTASETLGRSIVTLEGKTRELLAGLPPPIRTRIEPLSQRIPDGASSRMTLGQRFQNVIGILNEVNKFNRDIIVTSELRELSDGNTAEVETLYVGLAQGFYVTADGSAAGVGRPGANGWEWSQANALADEISRAIRILKNEEEPGYVPLPVTIQ